MQTEQCEKRPARRSDTTKNMAASGAALELRARCGLAGRRVVRSAARKRIVRRRTKVPRELCMPRERGGIAEGWEKRAVGEEPDLNLHALYGAKDRRRIENSRMRSCGNETGEAAERHEPANPQRRHAVREVVGDLPTRKEIVSAGENVQREGARRGENEERRHGEDDE